MNCEHCQQPSQREDLIVAIGPDGKRAWWARKDCPEHGMKVIEETSTSAVPANVE